MKGILTNISALKLYLNDDGSTLNLRLALIQEKTGKCEITIFGKILKTLEENYLHVINYVYLGKYKY